MVIYFFFKKNLFFVHARLCVCKIGSCQGVIALNMEDGTLHRFRAASSILATGVSICF